MHGQSSPPAAAGFTLTGLSATATVAISTARVAAVSPGCFTASCAIKPNANFGFIICFIFKTMRPISKNPSPPRVSAGAEAEGAEAAAWSLSSTTIS